MMDAWKRWKIKQIKKGSVRADPDYIIEILNKKVPESSIIHHKPLGMDSREYISGDAQRLTGSIMFYQIPLDFFHFDPQYGLFLENEANTFAYLHLISFLEPWKTFYLCEENQGPAREFQKAVKEFGFQLLILFPFV